MLTASVLVIVTWSQRGGYHAEAWSTMPSGNKNPSTTLRKRTALPTALIEDTSSCTATKAPPPTEINHFPTTRDRTNFLISTLLAFLTVVDNNVANAAETVGLDPDCTDRTCLGVWDGLLADCPHDTSLRLGGIGGAGCTSSQDDTPGIFSEPWDYSESRDPDDWQSQMRLLRPTIELVSSKRGDTCQIQLQQDRYLRVLFQDKRTGEKSIGEWYFTPNDTTVQFRIGSTMTSTSAIGSQRNIDRAEAIRKELRYLKIPVLRNRKRSLFFVESDLDSFGPGSAALGPPAEMKSGEIDNGGRLSDSVDPKLKIDLLQQFPVPPSKFN
jgi:uncharacterized protein (DUF1499 family)